MQISINTVKGWFWTALVAIMLNAHIPYNFVSQEEQNHMKRLLLLSGFLLAETMLLLSEHIALGVTFGVVGIAIGVWVSLCEYVKNKITL